MEKYGTVITKQNKEILKKWLLEKENFDREYLPLTEGYYVVNSNDDKSYQYWNGILNETIYKKLSFEEFCKQEGISMEKKSTDYCFLGGGEFYKWCENKHLSIAGNSCKQYYFNTTEELNEQAWDCTSEVNKTVITWQEFKQMFIDKTMKTTQEKEWETIVENMHLS